MLAIFSVIVRETCIAVFHAEELKTKDKAGHNSTHNAQFCWSRLCHLKSKYMYALIQMRHLVKTYLFL